MEQQCDGPPQQVQRDTTGSTIVGAIIGGALGHTVGKGRRKGGLRRSVAPSSAAR